MHYSANALFRYVSCVPLDAPAKIDRCSSGDIPWLKKMIDKHDENAKKQKVLVSHRMSRRD